VRRRHRIIAAAAAVPLVAVLAAARLSSRASRPVPPPASMAAAGDSVTAGFDLDWTHALRQDTAASWSTGTDPAVGSQYERLVALNPALAGHADNLARTGAKMADLDGQLRRAAGRHVAYVTILIGADDLCTSSTATMTPTGTFRSQFAAALRDFFAADPGAHVFVSSIPDLSRLWGMLHGSWEAQAKWGVGRICQSMLSWPGTASARRQVSQQEQADNASLAKVCTAHAHCRWDGYATFRAALSTGQISQVDDFHPNVAGERALAAVTWAAGYWSATHTRPTSPRG
jgi:lysophospholipase L1-like esterase